MKKIIFTALVFLVFSINAQTNITKNLGDFSILKVFNGIQVELIKSDEQKINVSGKNPEKVTIKNINNTLKISLPFSLNPSENAAEEGLLVTVFYNSPIDIIDANEGATITSKEINQDKLEVNAQERAFINMVVNVKHLEVRASSGGIIKLTGTTKSQNIDLDLYGVYEGFKLESTTISTVRAGTGAKAEILAGQTMNAKVSFGGSIFYKGNPDIVKDKKVMGGIIQKRD